MKKDSNRGSSIILLSPAILALILTLVLPSVWAAILSFFKYKLGSEKVFVGMRNYLAAFSDTEAFWPSLLRTALLTLVLVAGEMLLGILGSMLLATKYKRQNLWVSLLIAPMAVSPVVAIIVWKYMLAPNYGIINYLIKAFGMTEPNWFVNPFYIYLAIILIDLWIEIPFVFTMIYPAIISISPSLYEAAKIDGANYVKSQYYITIPLIKPIIVTTLVFRLIFAIRMFEPIWLFARGGPASQTKVFSIYLYEQAFVYWRFGAGSAIAWILMILTIAISVPMIRTMRNTMFGEKSQYE